jgi:hypothetical protein
MAWLCQPIDFEGRKWPEITDHRLPHLDMLGALHAIVNPAVPFDYTQDVVHLDTSHGFQEAWRPLPIRGLP